MMLAVDIWADVVGQDHVVAQLRAAAQAPVHAYLLVGPRGSGKRAAARAFTAALLGPEERDVRLALAEQHPDVEYVERVGPYITVDQAEDIVRRASFSPVEGDRKVLVLVDFHLVQRAAPKLLKIIEEPPPGTFFVILAEEVPPELVTIASRSVRIDLSPVPETAIAERLVAEGIDAGAALDATRSAGGDLDRARLLATDPRFVVRRDAWRAVARRLDGTGAVVVQTVAELRAHVDDAAAPLAARHATELLALKEREERYGTRGSGRKAIEERQRRELRRLRLDELRFGLAVLAGSYRDALATGARPRPLVEAVAAIQDAAEALVRNPNESLLLHALLLRLPSI
jgi:DNA polymerase-3 subunit delta'